MQFVVVHEEQLFTKKTADSAVWFKWLWAWGQLLKKAPINSWAMWSRLPHGLAV